MISCSTLLCRTRYDNLAVGLIIISNFGYAIGESFIASFLPDLGPPEDLGKISGFGWAVGYIGMVSTVVALIWIGEVSIENLKILDGLDL